MAFKELIDKVANIDKDYVSKRFPDQKWKMRFERARIQFETIMKDTTTRRRTDPDFIESVEHCTSEMSEIYTCLHPRSELNGRARLNEAVMWATAEYAERAIYLAGAAREAGINEPYRTQLQNLPAHACLQRYRQVWGIKEYVQSQIEVGMSHDVTLTLHQMQASYLAQFSFFANAAYQNNTGHNLAAYHKMLSHLLVGFTRESVGDRESAEAHYKVARSVVQSIKQPYPQIHYMQHRYLKRMYAEFTSFSRLSRQHPEILMKLTDLNDMAEKMDDNDVFRPKEYFNAAHYVQLGTRSASVAGLLLITANLVDLDTKDVLSAIDYLWSAATSFMFDAERSGSPDYALLDTGGLARQLASDTGGLASILTAEATNIKSLVSANVVSDLLLA